MNFHLPCLGLVSFLDRAGHGDRAKPTICESESGGRHAEPLCQSSPDFTKQMTCIGLDISFGHRTQADRENLTCHAASCLCRGP